MLYFTGLEKELELLWNRRILLVENETKSNGNMLVDS
jgi:hypothetical protein